MTGDSESDPEGEDDAARGAERTDGRTAEGVNEDAPLAELAARIESIDDESAASAFREMEVGEADATEVWAELDDTPAAHPDAVESVETDAERDVRRISKSICHGCQYFASPPETRCTHEGTEIREMPDAEHFVVVDCPVVADYEFEDG